MYDNCIGFLSMRILSLWPCGGGIPKIVCQENRYTLNKIQMGIPNEGVAMGIPKNVCQENGYTETKFKCTLMTGGLLR